MFANFEDRELKLDEGAATQDAGLWPSYFSAEHDPSALRCESNVLRYQPCRGVILRLETDNETIRARAQSIATTCAVPLQISVASEESEAHFISRLPLLAQSAEFLRTLTPPSDAVLSAAYKAGLNWINAPILTHERIELTRWHREQSISETRHRYGQMASETT